MARRLWQWEEGRQKSGYDKLLIATGRWPLPFDCYLLRFPVGAEIVPHVDQVKGGRHFRLNIVLKASAAGGEFLCSNAIINTRRVKLFRPDLSTHSVTRVEGSARYVLSVGWLLK